MLDDKEFINDLAADTPYDVMFLYPGLMLIAADSWQKSMMGTNELLNMRITGLLGVIDRSNTDEAYIGQIQTFCGYIYKLFLTLSRDESKLDMTEVVYHNPWVLFYNKDLASALADKTNVAKLEHDGFFSREKLDADTFEREYGIFRNVFGDEKPSKLHTMGFSLVRPQTYPNKDELNKEERQEFKKN